MSRILFNTLTQEWTEVKSLPGDKKLQLITHRAPLPDEIRIVNAPPKPHVAQNGTIRVYRNMLRVTTSGIQPEHLRDTRRGAIDISFDGKKRKRMLDCLNQWRMPMRNMIFLHLTYPGEYPLNWQVWKTDLKRFKALLLHKWPDAQGMWKLELQRRGAPHYHMIIDLGETADLRRVRAWVDAAWARIAHMNDEFQGKYACRVEWVSSIRHAQNYVAKYMNKPNYAPVDDDGEIKTLADLGETIGRQWGKIGKLDCSFSDEIPMSRKASTFVRLTMALELAWRGARGARGLLSGRGRGSFTVYGLGDGSDDRFRLAHDVIENAIDEYYATTNKNDAYFDMEIKVNQLMEKIPPKP